MADAAALPASPAPRRRASRALRVAEMPIGLSVLGLLLMALGFAAAWLRIDAEWLWQPLTGFGWIFSSFGMAMGFLLAIAFLVALRPRLALRSGVGFLLGIPGVWLARALFSLW